MPKRKGAAASAAKKKKFGSDAESSGDEWGSAAKVSGSAYLHLPDNFPSVQRHTRMLSSVGETCRMGRNQIHHEHGCGSGSLKLKNTGSDLFLVP